MELIIFITFIGIAFILAYIGFQVEPVNPYLFLFSSMILFVASMSLIAEGLEIPTGNTDIEINMSVTQINGTINDEQQILTGIRSTSFNLIILLISLYMAFLGIGNIIEQKYGAANVK